VRLSTGARVLCAAIVLLALVNLFIMQQGRTGPVLILPLLVLWSWQTFLRGRPMHAGRVAVAVGIAVVVGGAALAYVAHHKSSRMAEFTRVRWLDSKEKWSKRLWARYSLRSSTNTNWPERL
jgi:hypothetical protein